MCWFPYLKNQTIIRKRDGSFEICGYGIGNSKKEIDLLNGTYGDTEEITYSYKFLPAQFDE